MASPHLETSTKDEPTPKRTAIYARISDTDDKVDKPARQTQQCRDFITQNGYAQPLAKFSFKEEISAFRGLHRPGFEKLVEAASRGDFDVIVAVAEDRLTRQPNEKMRLLAACGTGGVVLHTIADGVLDPASDEGQLFGYFRSWMGRREQTTKSKRQRIAFESRREEGKPLWGVRPFGFELDRIAHRESEAQMIKDACTHVLAGGPLWELAWQWNAAKIYPTTQQGAKDQLAALRKQLGKRPPSPAQKRRLDRLHRYVDDPPGWSYATLVQMLRRPRNAGLDSVTCKRSDDGCSPLGPFKIIEREVAWDPIVERDTWEAVCRKLNDPERRSSTTTEPRWLVAGLALCGLCGSVMRPATGSSRGVSRPVYRCESKRRPKAKPDGIRHPAVGARELDGMVVGAVTASFLVGVEQVDAVLRDDEEQELEALHDEVADLKVEEYELHQSVNDGWDLSKLRPRMKKVQARKAEVQALIDGIEERSARAAMLSELHREMKAAWVPTGVRDGAHEIDVERLARLKDDLTKRFCSLPLDKRRALVKSLLTVTVKNGRGMHRVDIVHKGSPQLDVIERTDEL